ncbi:MAG: CpsB/CapC family capsule biosynthesis tyrosine phosphatase [Ruminococcus sp.]|nr:CpsB/CapC family capsule biosynthesis tyrosine phosphatase [Ruminococcus sp.]
MYYDMHSHILPEMDDGSKSVEMSLEIIDKLRAQDVKNICFTPHYYTNEESMRTFLNRRKESMDKLIPHLPDDINYRIGAEVYVTDYLFNNDSLSEICYGNSKYILCEFSFGSHFSDRTFEQFYKLKAKGLKPVLTHIERYRHLMDDEGLVEDLCDEDIIIQTNVGAFKGFSQKRRLLKYIKRGYIDIVGTDCHNLERGNPDEYLPTIELIRNKCGQEYVDHIINTSREIFGE